MTTKELFESRKKELKDWQYGTVYKLYDREEECEILADDVDRYFDVEFLKELEASIRKEVVEEIVNEVLDAKWSKGLVIEWAAKKGIVINTISIDKK